jgi:aryl-alcohol dehydrogenase-like predicted oxidoreductase
MSGHELTRREFVKVGAAGAAGLMVAGAGSAAGPPMPERPLGRTGHMVRLFSLGGQATLERPGTRDESIAIINRAIDLGVNYIDTAAAYGRSRTPGDSTPPISQSYIGEVMKTRRREVFLASKTHDRTRDGSLRLLEESLRLLQTDHLDLWQLHNVRLDEQLDQIFGPGGAIEALVRARDEKMVRFLGITGHYDPAVLVRGIERFDFDTVLVALNPADRHRLSFIDGLLPVANRKRLGIVGMKIPARGRLLRADGVSSMAEAMRYVLTLPISTVIVGCDTVAQLEENVAIARAFTPMPEAEMRRLEALAAAYEPEGAWFKKRDTPAAGEPPDDQNTE